MPDGFSLARDLVRHIGQTVTIFTTSGGQSGGGFTGVLASVNDRFVRLITQIGSAPGCALGNCCEEERDHCREEERDRCREEERDHCREEEIDGCHEEERGHCGKRHKKRRFKRNEEFREENFERESFVGGEEFRNRDDRGNRFDCSGRTQGSIVDIPVDRIAAFVHNTVGSGW